MSFVEDMMRLRSRAALNGRYYEIEFLVVEPSPAGVARFWRAFGFDGVAPGSVSDARLMHAESSATVGAIPCQAWIEQNEDQSLQFTFIMQPSNIPEGANGIRQLLAAVLEVAEMLSCEQVAIGLEDARVDSVYDAEDSILASVGQIRNEAAG